MYAFQKLVLSFSVLLGASQVCPVEVLHIEAEVSVAFLAGADVGNGRDGDAALLVHDVDECRDLSDLAACQPDRQADFLLVVELRVALVDIEPLLIIDGHFPHGDRNQSAVLRLNGEVGSRLAALVEQLVIGDR